MGRFFSGAVRSILVIVGALSLVTITVGGLTARQAGAALLTPAPIADGAPTTSSGGGGSSVLWVVLFVLLVAVAGYFAQKKIKRPTGHANVDHSACIADWAAARQATDAARRAAGGALGQALGRIEKDFHELERSLDDASRAFSPPGPDSPHEAVAQDDSVQLVARVLAELDGSGGAR
jgi:hypothetical protein